MIHGITFYPMYVYFCNVYFLLVQKKKLNFFLNQLSLDDISQYLFRVLTTLEAAHERCIIHGDMKPINVMRDREKQYNG
jgi:serine/threonine protein kinase